MKLKPIRIGHFSDIHGNLSVLMGAETPDIWVSSGDIFPNATRGRRDTEVLYQRSWFARNESVFLNALKGAPVVVVSGNHDYVDLADLLTKAGHPTVYSLDHGKPVSINGLTFSGFREVPWIAGEWEGEVQESDILVLVQRALNAHPDVLVTHTPPAGILDRVWDGTHPGSKALVSNLMYGQGCPKVHLFGHIHDQGGQTMELRGVQFYNGACHLRYLDVEPSAPATA